MAVPDEPKAPALAFFAMERLVHPGYFVRNQPLPGRPHRWLAVTGADGVETRWVIPAHLFTELVHVLSGRYPTLRLQDLGEVKV